MNVRVAMRCHVCRYSACPVPFEVHSHTLRLHWMQTPSLSDRLGRPNNTTWPPSWFAVIVCGSLEPIRECIAKSKLHRWHIRVKHYVFHNVFCYVQHPVLHIMCAHYEKHNVFCIFWRITKNITKNITKINFIYGRITKNIMFFNNVY